MQCPNCKKEAINVNGKYVCLDCGVELTPTQVPQVIPEEVPAISKYGGADEPTVAEPAVSEPEQPNIEPVAPLIEPILTEQPEPVKNEFLNELAAQTEQTSTGFDFESKETEPTVAVPTTDPDPEPAKSESYFSPVTVDITPAKPVLAEMQTAEPFVGDLENSKTESELNPGNFPAEEPQEKAEELFVGEVPAAQVPQPMTEAAVSAAPPVPSPGLDELLSQYATPPQSVPVVTPAPSFDSLQSVSPGFGTLPVNPPEVTPQSSSQPAMPGAGSIPSAESVFGPSPENSGVQFQMPKKNNKKMIIIIVTSIVGVLVILGLVMLGISLSKQKSTGNSNSASLEQAATLKISEEISQVMDLPLSTTATFEQSLDFSEVTIPNVEGSDGAAEDTLKKLFGKPLTAAGTYKTDENGNMALDATLGVVVVKKTYLTGDRSTYVFNQTAGNWTSVAGDKVTEVPAFYPPQTKAALFYNTKTDVLKELGKEAVDGANYRKIQIKPKAEIVKEVLSGADTSLFDTVYSNLTLDQLEVYAWVTDEGKVYKIAVSGSIGVTSDKYEGTVKITSSVTFDYNPVEITKP